MKSYIGIDNGVTGSIGLIVIEDNTKIDIKFFKTPLINQQDYTKKKKRINRLNPIEFLQILYTYKDSIATNDKLAIIERPMVNPQRFNATLSAIRTLESTLTILESNQIPYMFVDSKQWQKEMLPKGCKGKDQLKKASMDTGIRMYPQFKELITNQKDADGLLIATWAWRNKL
ncbi:MAG: hypothetical protein ACFFDN_02040 [Candidatus Hodarchaeota archaeon]